ncbi:MAG: DUF5009 domain-containing protein [Hyphomicrobiaceae bacterium]
MPNVSAAAPGSARLLSVDALRGFTIIWIVGGDNVVGSLARLAKDQGGWTAWVGEAIGAQFQHVPWVGLTFYDLIFPMFVFVTGVSITLSLGRLTAPGRGAAYRRIGRRAIALFVLGVIVAGGVAEAWPNVRLAGVLQRIGLCYLAASVLFLLLDWRGLAGVMIAILVGYWALLTFVPVPGIGVASFDEAHNLVRWVDGRYLPGKRWYGDWDPEGLLSTVPAVATCLLGVLAGKSLSLAKLAPMGRAWWLVAAGVACVLVGWLWGFQLPIVKKLWTSSFVLFAGGWCLILLGLFYGVVDAYGVRRWAGVFIWVGSNAIALYLVQNLVGFESLAKRIAGGSVRASLDAALAPGTGLLVIRLIALALAIWFARYLYRRSIFLRV